MQKSLRKGLIPHHPGYMMPQRLLDQHISQSLEVMGKALVLLPFPLLLHQQGEQLGLLADGSGNLPGALREAQQCLDELGHAEVVLGSGQRYHRSY